MDDFLDQIVEALDAAGFAVQREMGAFHVKGHRFEVEAGRKGRILFLGSSFKAPYDLARALGLFMTELPRLIAEEQRRKGQTEREMRRRKLWPEAKPVDPDRWVQWYRVADRAFVCVSPTGWQLRFDFDDEQALLEKLDGSAAPADAAVDPAG